MAELTIAQAVKVLHKLAGKSTPEKMVSETAFVNETGGTKPQHVPIMWQAEPVAWPELQLKTNKQIAKARESGVRMERLVARSGKSKADVLKALEAEGVDPSAYVGRGRRHDGSSASTTSSSSGSGKGRGSGNGRGSSGRRAAANSGAGKGAAPARARTRAERQAKNAGNPS